MTTAHFTDAERRITLIGVMIVFLLSALDQTIVSTAMPVIISQLHGLELYAWVTTAYLLSSTVMVPVWGKLGDLYGRKPVLLAGIGLFLLGSWLSGLAGEFGTLPLLGGGMVQLIVFRAVQGLGGGALFTTAFAIIADLFPPRERGKFAGLFGGVFGLGVLAFDARDLLRFQRRLGNHRLSGHTEIAIRVVWLYVSLVAEEKMHFLPRD